MTTTPRHLQLVDEKYRSCRRAYAIFVDPEDEQYQVALLRIEGGEHDRIIINADEDRPADEVDMRLHLACLVVADELILPDTWWTSTAAHKLVQIAGWCGIKLISPDGVTIETTSAAGGR